MKFFDIMKCLLFSLKGYTFLLPLQQLQNALLVWLPSRRRSTSKACIGHTPPELSKGLTKLDSFWPLIYFCWWFNDFVILNIVIAVVCFFVPVWFEVWLTDGFNWALQLIYSPSLQMVVREEFEGNFKGSFRRQIYCHCHKNISVKFSPFQGVVAWTKDETFQSQ